VSARPLVPAAEAAVAARVAAATTRTTAWRHLVRRSLQLEDERLFTRPTSVPSCHACRVRSQPMIPGRVGCGAPAANSLRPHAHSMHVDLMHFSVPAGWPISRTSGAAFSLGTRARCPAWQFSPRAWRSAPTSTFCRPTHVPSGRTRTRRSFPMDGVQVDSGSHLQFHVTLSFSAHCLDLHGLTACPATHPRTPCSSSRSGCRCATRRSSSPSGWQGTAWSPGPSWTHFGRRDGQPAIPNRHVIMAILVVIGIGVGVLAATMPPSGPTYSLKVLVADVNVLYKSYGSVASIR